MLQSIKKVCCIELGGFSAAVAISDRVGSFLWKKKGIPTSNPISGDEAVKNICDAIRSSNHDFDSIGIASFGPIDIKNGMILNTPKPNWRQYPLVESIRENLKTKVPIILETDVNAPAYSEFLAQTNRDPSIQALAYLTVGNGVGLGVFMDGKTLHGIMHPEFGHMKLKHMPGDDFEGTCPFHKDCLEGLLSAGALAKRMGILPSEIRDVQSEDKIWNLFAYYVASTAASAAMSYSIDTMVVGGGIITAEGRGFIYNKANAFCTDMINDYIQVPKIIPPIYQEDAGLVGAAAIGFHPDVFIK